MNIEREWQARLEQVKKSIEDYQSILENNELTYEMKMYCLSEIEKKSKYAQLIQETLNKLDVDGKYVN